MATVQELESALVKADAAGSVDDARVLAAEIRRLRAATQAPAPKPPPQAPVRPASELFAMRSPYAKETGLGPLQMLRGAATDMFAGEGAAAKYFAEAGGGSVGADPETGDPLLVAPSGDRYRINDPGLDLQDVANVAGNVAAFLPAAKMVQGVAGLGRRVFAGGAAAGATDAGLQYGLTGEVRPDRTALSAAGGGVGEVIAPIFGGLFRAARTGTMSRAELVTRGRNEMARLAQSGEMDDATLAAFGRQVDQIEAGGDPNALLSEAEFGFRYTRGQKTASPSQLNTEERLRNTAGSRAGEILTQNDQFNYGKAIGAVDDLQRSITGRPQRINPVAAVDNAGQVVRAEEEALSGRVNDAYDRFRSTKAYVGVNEQRQLPDRIRAAVADFDISPETTPAGNRALTIISDTFGDPKTATSAKAIDATRKRLRSLYGAASNDTDRAVVTRTIKEYDGWLDDAATQGLVAGDPSAIQALKEARALRSEYGKRFGDTGEFATRFDTAVRQMVKDGADPEQLATTIFGASQVSQSWANRAMLRVESAMGNNPQAIADFRGAVLTKLVQGKTGETVGLQQLQSNLRTLINERPTLAKNLLGADGLEKTKRLIGAMEPLLKTVDKRSSGTTERMWRYMTDLVRGVPLLGPVLDAARAASDTPAAVRALAPLPAPRPGFVPAMGAAAANQQQR